MSAALTPASQWKKKVRTAKESEGVGRPVIVVVQLLLFTRLELQSSQTFLSKSVQHVTSSQKAVHLMKRLS